jgi:hypothetical protein
MPPHSLLDYVCETDLHPQRGKGADWWANVRRDILIMGLMRLVQERYGIALSRSSGSIGKKLCAADVVADALTKSKVLGRAITDKTVASVCRRRPPLPPGWFALIASKLGRSIPQ